MNIEGEILRCLQTNVKIGQTGTSFPKNLVRFTAHLHGATDGQTLAATRPPPFKAIPSFALERETDDKQVVGNQQNGGRTHMQCKMEWVKSQTRTFLNFFVAPALSY